MSLQKKYSKMPIQSLLYDSASSSCSSPPETPELNHNNNVSSSDCLARQMNSLVKLVPSIIEAACVGKKKEINNGGLPTEIKSRLHLIFGQIELEFDSLYAENVRLQQELYNSSTNKSIELTTPPPKSNNLTISSTSTLVSQTSQIEKQQQPVLITKQAITKPFTKTLTFPKFRPNAREFILQSIKNTSAQIVNKTSSSNNSSSQISTKLQYSLSGHRDGIWDINCLEIPDHLFNNSSFELMNNGNYNNNKNVLIGTASADCTARLWYLNSQFGNNSNGGLELNNGSPQTPGGSSGHNGMQTNGFCIQQYCGHTGSVNSVRFHPRFFTEATNLILTASGDTQAHIWQCVLSPTIDSLESTSEVVLNYPNCYSFATQKQTNQFSPHTTPNNNNYKDLISNTPIIRSPIKRFLGHNDVCIAADWFPDGDLLATASWDRTANVYNVETGKVLCTMQHDDLLTNVNIHPVQKIILTSSKDHTFKVWDFRDPICSVNVYQGHNRSVNSAIFVTEDKIATSSDDQTVKLWDLRIMRSPVCTLSPNSGINRLCTMRPPDSNETLLCLPLDNREIKIYNLAGERVIRMPRSGSGRAEGHQRIVTSLTCFGNLLISGSFDKTVNCWLVDYNSQKANVNNGAVKFNFNNCNNNKENNSQFRDGIINTTTDSNTNTPLSQTGLIPTNEQQQASPPHKQRISSSSSSFYESPCTNITNNTTTSGGGTNSNNKKN